MHSMCPQHKSALFHAIACMARLHTLIIPDWHSFVARHVTCLTPLLCMESLQKVVVRRAYGYDSGAFPAALRFESLPEHKCSCGDESGIVDV